MANVLRDAGWRTFWVGKNHNVPIDEWTMGASKKNWPLGQGYDRFYGFIGGETNNWYPDLAEDNHYIDQPYLPEDGYHLSKDLADKALRIHPRLQAVRAGQALVPVVLPRRQPRPAPRAAGVHRQVQGQVRRRLRGLPRVGAAAHDRAGHPARGHRADADQPDARGHVQRRRDVVRPWDELNDDEKALFCRMAEVYAGFSEYTDAQVGRIVDYLEESGQLDNTIIFYCADNGASGEGSPNGSVNEGKFFNGYPDDIEENLTMIDQLGSPDTYNHYPTGWAVAFSTPYRMFKRYTYQGGVCDPLVIHWPAGHQGAAARSATSTTTRTDIVPTILDVLRRRDAGRRRRRRADAAARRVDALLVRRRRRADAEGDAVLRDARQPRHLAQGLEGGHRARPDRPASGNFDEDRWQLFHTDEDRSEAHDLADQHPEKVEELKALWIEEAEANNVLPLNDLQSSATRGLREFLEMEFHIPVPPSGQYTYYPGTTEVPERSAANVARRLVQGARRGRAHAATPRA